MSQLLKEREYGDLCRLFETKVKVKISELVQTDTKVAMDIIEV